MNLAKQIKVVYVEDQLGVRKSICDFLNGFENIEVAFDTDSGSELMTYLKQNPPLPSICILDITMPEMDGLTILKRIQKKSKIPCLIYSMHRDEYTITEAIHHGASGYLSKQYDYNALYKAVIEIINNGIAYTNDADSRMFDKVRNQEVEIFTITDREREWIQYAGTEHSYQGIAHLMGISYNTGEGYRSKCFKKLNVNNRATLVVKAIRLGIINI